MNVLTALETLDAQYRDHPQALDPAFQAAVVWPALRAADPEMPLALNIRGRPGEEHEWPLLFWAVLTQRIAAHRQAEAWSAGQSPQQVVLAWVDERQAAAAQLHTDWAAEQALERRMWGEPDADVYTPLHDRLDHGTQALRAFAQAVRQGAFRPTLARLLVWESTTGRPSRPLAQPTAQLQRWLNETQRVILGIQAWRECGECGL
ncbi:hypothetical protein LAJ19_16660 (plasmid) [Deinococcus taeanensis]|uniref:hypothetical protein n=1 Tax=Deinococcus taeanensis TaxID=2737050 RepID=UPI001CDC6FEA|nr:hypothetical protein [Deinococcus taeanensis]UBV44777.1 hypothetical protein LAJ19_16660 [Deinococcus taeanensis]